MKQFLDTIKNIFAIEDLRKRIFLTLGLLFIYRLGCFVVLPGVDPSKITSGGASGIFQIFDLFAGGAFSQASVFALGIMPYISTSIVMQLLTLAVPYFQKLQKEGESGRKKITQWTRMGTVAVTAVQGFAYVKFIYAQNIVSPSVSPFLFTASTMIILMAGTVFVMWLGEQIQERGLGNGTSLIIMANIISKLPASFWAELKARATTGSGILIFVLEVVVLALVIIGTIMLIQAIRKVPLSYAKQISGGSNAYTQRRGFLPLKVNIAGVMPIIFAQAFLFIPGTVAQLMPDSAASPFLRKMTDFTSMPYNIIMFLMVVLFTYFYTALIMNPTQMADDLKRNNGFIPGVKPGANTAEYIDTVLSRITLPGSMFLGLIAIMPSFANMIGINSQFAQFFGGTSLLILVSVVLDTMQQINSHLLSRHYDGLTKSGAKIRGRNVTTDI
ncbi:MAG TPA: preprotein translocase subunit SecY [Chitinophagales bacterium]|jgi:preprotein translocase subunit SecY|nr:preprotein translocase subunit SecY [Chitinophagales bacterium]HQO88319.1 preprotein translocase subunit SecY [Chitinophagales bacterium]